MINQTSQAASLVKLQIDDSKVLFHDKKNENDKLFDFQVDENIYANNTGQAPL